MSRIGINIGFLLFDYQYLGLCPAHCCVDIKMAKTKNLSDEDLVCRFRETQNNQLFRVLANRYEQRLYIAAMKLLGNEDECQEAVQETFVRVLANLPKYKTKVPFAAWIFTIMNNLCKDLLRAKQRRPLYESLSYSTLSLHEQEECGKEYRQKINRIADRLPNPEQQVENAERKALIMQSIACLPSEQKKAIILRDFEGLSYEQIADITGTALGTVRSRLHYGREKLKTSWKHFLPCYQLKRNICWQTKK